MSRTSRAERGVNHEPIQTRYFDEMARGTFGGDQMNMLNVLGAQALRASRGLDTVVELARTYGDDALGLIADELDTVAGSLGGMTTREAQGVIGPAVNFAGDARRSVESTAKVARGGHMPAATGIEEAARSVRVLSNAIGARADRA